MDASHSIRKGSKERDALCQEMAEWEHKVWDAMRKKRKLLNTALLRDVLVSWEGTVGQCRLQDAMGKVKEGLVTSAPEVVEEMSGGGARGE